MLRLGLRDLAGHPLRTGATVAVIAVCSALVVAVAGLVHSVEATANELATDLAGTADLEVVAPFSGATLDEATLDAVAGADGVATVAPTIQTGIELGAPGDGDEHGEGERALLLAADARAVDFLPRELADVPGAEWAGRLAAGEVVVSAPVGRRLGVAAGDDVVLRGPDGRRRRPVAGVLPAEVASSGLVVADLATAADLRGGAGYDRLLVALDTGASPGTTMQEIRAAVGDRAAVVDPDSRARDATEATGTVVRPLVMLAGLTVGVAAVLVFNVVSLSVAERRRHLAVTRALGARRRRLWLALVAEAALLGVVGGVLGAAVGRAVTAMLVEGLPPALVEAALPTRIDVDVPLWLLAAGVAVGVVATLTAAGMAAAGVVRLSPVEAMGARDVVGEPAAPIRPAGLGAGVAGVLAGVGLLAAGPVGAQSSAAFLVLVGVVVLVWTLRRPLTATVARVVGWIGPSGLLAGLAVGRSPARHTTTALAALLPVAAVVCLGGLQANINDTSQRDVASLGETELHVSAQPLSQVTDDVLLPPDLAGEVSALDGVRSARPGRFSFVRLDGGEVLVEGVTAGSSVPLLRAASAEARRRVAESAGAVVSQPLARRLDLVAGDTLTVPTVAGEARVVVADVVDVLGWPGGMLIVDYDRLAAWTGDPAPSWIEVDTRGDGATVAAAIERHVAPSGEEVLITPGDAAVEDALLSVRQAQGIFATLQAVLMASGGFAIVSTLVVSTIGRTRELGLLRAVGARRRQVRRAVVVEAFALTLTGALLGVVVGVAFHYVAVRLAAEATGIPADFALVVGPSAGALAAASLVAAAAAVATARRLVRLDVLAAVAYE